MLLCGGRGPIRVQPSSLAQPLDPLDQSISIALNNVYQFVLTSTSLSAARNWMRTILQQRFKALKWQR